MHTQLLHPKSYAAIYGSLQVNTSMHTIFHSHALLLSESMLLVWMHQHIQNVEYKGQVCWNLSEKNKK